MKQQSDQLKLSCFRSNLQRGPLTPVSWCNVNFSSTIQDEVDDSGLADALLRLAGHPGADALESCLAEAVERGGIHVSASLEELLENYLTATVSCRLKGGQASWL